VVSQADLAAVHEAALAAAPPPRGRPRTASKRTSRRRISMLSSAGSSTSTFCGSRRQGLQSSMAAAGAVRSENEYSCLDRAAGLLK